MCFDGAENHQTIARTEEDFWTPLDYWPNNHPNPHKDQSSSRLLLWASALASPQILRPLEVITRQLALLYLNALFVRSVVDETASLVNNRSAFNWPLPLHWKLMHKH